MAAMVARPVPVNSKCFGAGHGELAVGATSFPIQTHSYNSLKSRLPYQTISALSCQDLVSVTIAAA